MRGPRGIWLSLLALLMWGLLCARAEAALAEERVFGDPARPSELASALGLGVSFRGGGARAPFFTSAFPEVLGHGLVLQVAGAYRFGHWREVAVRVPVVFVEIEQPAGSYLTESSWGNANVSAAQWQPLGSGWFGVLRLALALPLAASGPPGSLLRSRALQLANAMDALRWQELYTAGVLPIAASYGLVLEQPHMRVEANLRAPFFLRFGRAGLPSDARARRIAMTPVLHLAARYMPVGWANVGLAADAVLDRLAPLEPTRDEPAVQYSLTPDIGFRLGGSWRLGADFVLPVAGPLGGHAYSGGLRVGYGFDD